jgi:heme oxygenase
MSILQRLKQETQSLHQQLEQRVDVMHHLQSVAAYQELLIAFYGYYAPLEEVLERVDWRGVGLHWPERRKVNKLDLDLQRLGIDSSKLPRCEQLPAIPNLESALGCLYVLEGATLGGQIIQKEIAEQLQIFAHNGAAFFNSYGEQVGPMWAKFREVVVNFATKVNQEDRILRTAQDTFQKFDDWLIVSKPTHMSWQ